MQEIIDKEVDKMLAHGTIEPMEFPCYPATSKGRIIWILHLLPKDQRNIKNICISTAFY